MRGWRKLAHYPEKETAEAIAKDLQKMIENEKEHKVYVVYKIIPEKLKCYGKTYNGFVVYYKQYKRR